MLNNDGNIVIPTPSDMHTISCAPSRTKVAESGCSDVGVLYHRLGPGGAYTLRQLPASPSATRTNRGKVSQSPQNTVGIRYRKNIAPFSLSRFHVHAGRAKQALQQRKGTDYILIAVFTLQLRDILFLLRASTRLEIEMTNGTY